MVNLRRSTAQREDVRRDVDTVAKKNCLSESDNSCKARNILKLNRRDLPSSILPENLRRRAHRLALKKKRGNDGTGNSYCCSVEWQSAAVTDHRNSLTQKPGLQDNCRIARGCKIPWTSKLRASSYLHPGALANPRGNKSMILMRMTLKANCLKWRLRTTISADIIVEMGY